MRQIPMPFRLLLLSLAIGLCANQTFAQNSRQQNPPATTEPAKAQEVRLKLTNGSYLVVDDAWETPQGIWYRQGGISHLLTKDRVKAIERGAPPPPRKREEPEELTMETPPQQTKSETGVYDRPAWIYLVGGARVEADSATQSTAGVWYKRGSMTIFIDRSRVERIEPEDMEIADSTKPRERGWSTGSSKLDQLIRQNGGRYRVDPYLIFLVMEQESHFNPRVVSPKGARGLMQLMPGTSARFGVRHPHDPAQNISGGTRYLRQLLDRFNNRVDLVLASYNAGEGAVMKFGRRVPPYRETRNYVKRISYRYRRTIARTRTPAQVDAAQSTAER